MAMKNCISIDWEDWFHICEVEEVLPRAAWDSYPSILDEATDRILEKLAARNCRATFFLVGYSARRQPELVRRIAAAGHEIAHHTMEHELVYDMTPETFRRDLAAGKKLLEELGNCTVRGFRAPQWSANQRTPWVTDALLAAGYSYDSSRAPLPIIGSMDFPHTVHRLAGVEHSGSLVELPPLVVRLPGLNLPAGGGWGLHCLPLAWIVRRARALNAQGSPATFFFHPADFVRHRHGAGLPFIKKLVTSFQPRPIERTWEILFDQLEFAPLAEVADMFVES